MATEDVKINFQVDGNAEKVLKLITKAVKDLGDESSDTSKKTSTAFETFKGVLGAAGVVGAVNLATDAAKKLFDTFVVQGIGAASEQEDAIKKLNVALSQSGDFSAAASQDLQNFATSLQSSSVFSDELIISQLALAKSFNTTNEEAKALVEAAVNLSAQTGQDLNTSVRQLGQTLDGTAGRVAEMVPELKLLTAEQLKAGDAIDIVAQKYGGSALAQTQTYSGAIAKLGLNFNEVQETIGGFITQNPAIVTAVNLISERIAIFNESLASEGGGIKQFINQLVPQMITGVGYVVEAFGYFGEVVELVLLPFTAAVAYGTSNIVALSYAMTGDFETAKLVFSQGIDEVKQKIGEAFSFEDSETVKAGEAIRQLGKDVEENTAKTQAAMNSLPPNQKKVNKELEDGQKKTFFNINQFEKLSTQERLSNLQSTTGYISQLTKSSNKELFAIGKAAAISTATIDGILAVQKALASAPVPINFVLAALVGAATAVNVANIAATPPPAFASGSSFVGGAPGTDNVPAFLSRGERVFTTDQNKDFSAFLQTEGSNSVLLGAILDKLSNMQSGVSVQIGGKTLVNTLQDELDAGLVLSV